MKTAFQPRGCCAQLFTTFILTLLSFALLCSAVHIFSAKSLTLVHCLLSGSPHQCKFMILQLLQNDTCALPEVSDTSSLSAAIAPPLPRSLSHMYFTFVPHPCPCLHLSQFFFSSHMTLLCSDGEIQAGTDELPCPST